MKKNKSSAKRLLNQLDTNPIPSDTLLKKDESPKIPQRDKIKNNLIIYQRSNLTEKQKQFINLALDKNTKMMLVSGPAGTAKTYLAIYVALTLLNEKRVSDLVYIRSAVESSDNKLGYLPGEASEKLAPYMEPLLDKLSEFLPKSDIDYLQKDNRITGKPVGYLRGVSYNAKFIISDESQNETQKELVTLMTRTGEFSKLLILGDPDQSDINGKSGFVKMINTFDDEDSRNNGIFVFRFGEEDIVRSKLVRFIVGKLKSKVDSLGKL